MAEIAMEIILILHGLVHGLYLAHARQLMDITKDLAWPVDSWVLAALVEERWLRITAAVLLGAAGLGFGASGLALLAGGSWWRTPLVTAGGISTLVYLLFWDGQFHRLADQGFLALVINLALLILSPLLLIGGPGQ